VRNSVSMKEREERAVRYLIGGVNEKHFGEEVDDRTHSPKDVDQERLRLIHAEDLKQDVEHRSHVLALFCVQVRLWFQPKVASRPLRTQMDTHART